jgi:hypothetical protein
LDLPIESTIQLNRDVHEIVEPDVTLQKWVGNIIKKDDYSYFVPYAIQPELSKIHLYNWYEQSARYLMEYTVYAFSKFAKDDISEQTGMTELYDIMVDFASQTFEIQPTICERVFAVSPYFGTTNPYYTIRDDLVRITIPSEDIRKKLMYRLVHDLQTKLKSVISYHSESHMRNYFISPSDFTKTNQILQSTPVFMSYLTRENNFSNPFDQQQSYSIGINEFKAPQSLHELLKNYPS